MKPGMTVLGLVLLGLPALWWRVGEAAGKAMNPDEVMIWLIARPEDWLERCREFHHPPLFYWLLHWVQRMNTSELALRSVSLIAGLAAPALLWAWMRRAGLETAAWMVAGMCWWGVGLTQLSAEVRGYALALALFAGAAWMQERWLATGGRGNLVGYGVLLWLAILTEYSVLFGWVSLGIYGWLERKDMGKGWWTIQVGAVLILGVLYWWQVRDLEQSRGLASLVEFYFARHLVQKGQNWLEFGVRRLPGALQFVVEEYRLVGALLVAGVLGVWMGGKARSLSVAAGVTACLAWGAAIAQRYPLGWTRHSMLLGVLLLVAGAVGMDCVMRGRSARWRFLVVVVFLSFTGNQAMQRVYLERDVLRSELARAMDEFQPGEWVWTEVEAIHVMRYYLKEDLVGDDPLVVRAYRLNTRKGVSLEAFQWNYGREVELQKDWANMSKRATAERVKLLDSGFTLMEKGKWPARRMQGVQVVEVER